MSDGRGTFREFAYCGVWEGAKLPKNEIGLMHCILGACPFAVENAGQRLAIYLTTFRRAVCIIDRFGDLADDGTGE